MFKKLFNYSFTLLCTLTMFSSFSKAQNLNFTIDVCGAAVNEVRLVGPLWNNWDPTSGPLGTDNGNGTWNVQVNDVLVNDLEYLVNLVDATGNHYESLVVAMQNGGTCAPITDYFSYANRLYVLNSADTIITYNSCTVCGTPSALNFTVEVCGPTPSEVRFVGPLWNNWDPTSGPVGTDNGDGTWNVAVTNVLSADLEFKIIVDGVQEELLPAVLNGGSCAPITDYFSYANRKYVLNSNDTLLTYNRCVPCNYPDVTITTEICTTVTPSTTAKLIGSPWNWSTTAGINGVNNGNNTFSFTFSPVPNDTVEYLIMLDGVQESLLPLMLNGGTCAPATDFSTYANRRWIIADGNAISNTYEKCSSCASNGTAELTNASIQVFPNPTDGLMQISAETSMSEIRILNLVGKEIFNDKVNSNKYLYDTSNLNEGMYLIQIKIGQNILNSSFIVK